MSAASVLIPYTDALRAWGFCAGVVALPDVWGLISRAVPKAFQQQDGRSALRALWHEGDGWMFNAWTLVLLAVTLLLAGAGIPVAHFFKVDPQQPLYLTVLNVSWLCLSGAGWSYNVTAAKRPKLMVLAAVILLFLLTLGAVYGGH